MASTSTESAALQARGRAFGPSWVDALQLVVQRLPWPGWVTYVGAWLVLASVETVLKGYDGAYPVGTVYPYHLVAFGSGLFGLALMHFLDRSAGRALGVLRPVLDLSDGEVTSLRYRLTTMPRWGAAVASLLGVCFGLFQRSTIVGPHLEAFHYADAGALLYYENGVILLFTWAVIGAFVYHSVRQLHLIDRLYRRHAVVDLFHARPLYAFSRFAAQRSVGILAIGYAWIVTYPTGVGASVVTLLFSSVGVLLALAILTFLWPVWGAHQRLVDERERRRQEAHRDIEATLRRLHEGIAEDDYASMDGLNKALAGLTQELTLVEKASTWPWQSSTLRGFLTAVLLPLFLWATQQLLGRVLVS